VDPADKYRAFPGVVLDDRRWPGRAIGRPPIWCSVDLRDGNQALVEPMDAERKLVLFERLCAMGFKEIEVGFPSASQTEFDFVQMLIEQGRIPEDVTIQVLTQCREPLIRRTVEALRGARRAICHLYNSTSTLQRRVVFGLPREGIVDIAVSGARLARELCDRLPDTEVVFQYSPESFTGTELDFAVEICERVMDVWEPTPDAPVILNLPATVEMSTPNVYADQIEWFGRHIRDRDHIVLSVHPHNDRGTAVAAAELAQMAGAERVEGTLFGNGERTGNVDVVTLALNLWSQGVDPGLDVSDLDALVEVVERCTRLSVHERHPYAGELVYTAFSGSHQDAIKKGFDARRVEDDPRWEVPYLPIDPDDVGRSYEAVVRVNSQSGKGGVAYLLERDHGLRLPRALQVEFARRVQAVTDTTGAELSSDAIFELFASEYLVEETPLSLVGHRGVGSAASGEAHEFEFATTWDGAAQTLSGKGSGPIEAFVRALHTGPGVDVAVTDYNEHALGRGADAEAVAYVKVATPSGGVAHGVGRDANVATASLRAVVSAVNRLALAARGGRTA
jgi:2-isopropylmalate synthase